jgi:sugar (pentulose or hexulose) kinase
LEGAELLPEIVSSSAIVGEALPAPAEALGVMPGTPVVAGAADRASEVLGVAATTSRPMVTWGMTAAVSVPIGHVPPPHQGIVVSRGAIGGYLMEAELSGAGWALAWLEDLTGRSAEQLAREADDLDAGAGGLLALAWLGGARAPWWEPRAGLTFVGLAAAHTPAHLTRALIEGIAFDAARCLERTAPDAVELALAGSGVSIPLWRHVLAGVSSRPVVTRRHGEAASVGAAIVTGRALGVELDPAVLDPIQERELPFDSDVVAYANLRMRHEMVARATLELVAGA